MRKCLPFFYTHGKNIFFLALLSFRSSARWDTSIKDLNLLPCIKVKLLQQGAGIDERNIRSVGHSRCVLVSAPNFPARAGATGFRFTSLLNTLTLLHLDEPNPQKPSKSASTSSLRKNKNRFLFFAGERVSATFRRSYIAIPTRAPRVSARHTTRI